MFHKRYLKWMKDLGEVSSNTASPQHFLHSCMLQSDEPLIVLSPGSLRKGDSLLVWPSQRSHRGTCGSEGFETRGWECGELDEGDWDPEVALSQQHCQVQGLLYWTGWVLSCHLCPSNMFIEIKKVNMRHLHVQRSARSILSFSLQCSVDDSGDWFSDPCCFSVNIENL